MAKNGSDSDLPLPSLKCGLSIVRIFFSTPYLAGGFKHFVFSSEKLGEMIQFDEHIFQMGWFNHQLYSSCRTFFHL